MQYTFKDFKWMATGDGFNYPIDVYYGTIFLGTLVALPHAYTIRLVDTPQGKEMIKHTPKNEFKSMEIAAEYLHRTWKHYRFGGYESGDTGETVPA
jgi:hypothetical protein